MSSDSVTPLFLDIQDDGEYEIDGAITYLSQTFGTDYAERFTAEVGRVLRETCQRIADEIAENGKAFDRTNERASLRFAQPVYRMDVSVARTRAA
ncbi:MAG: hypothetical protein H8F28_23170 [Fibrella sp.]|nr:hypothetical protein [Armatimonadota bacterium]